MLIQLHLKIVFRTLWSASHKILQIYGFVAPQHI